MLHVKTLKMDEPLSQYFAFITFIILYIGVKMLQTMFMWREKFQFMHECSYFEFIDRCSLFSLN
jgi:hypothetical protein